MWNLNLPGKLDKNFDGLSDLMAWINPSAEIRSTPKPWIVEATPGRVVGCTKEYGVESEGSPPLRKKISQ